MTKLEFGIVINGVKSNNCEFVWLIKEKWQLLVVKEQIVSCWIGLYVKNGVIVVLIEVIGINVVRVERDVLKIEEVVEGLLVEIVLVELLFERLLVDSIEDIDWVVLSIF